MADRHTTPRSAMEKAWTRQDGRSGAAIHPALHSTLGAHSFFALSCLSEIVIREIERRTALQPSTGHFQTGANRWSGLGGATAARVDVDSPAKRRRKVTLAFFAISAETEQPYRITEDCDVWAILSETEEDVPVSIYLDETHELLVERSTFLACTKPFTSN